MSRKNTLFFLTTFILILFFVFSLQNGSCEYIEGKSNQYGSFRLAPPERFIALTSPKYLSPKDYKLADDEMIIGLKIGNDVRCFPIRQMWYHHVVNDSVGGEKLSLTY